MRLIAMICSRKRGVFALGFVIGVVLAFLFHKTENVSIKDSCLSQPTPQPKIHNYNDWFASRGLRRKLVNYDELVYGSHKDLTEASYLENEISVLCAVFVRKTRNAEAVKNTWGKHCNSIVFIGMQSVLNSGDSSIPLVNFQPKNSFHFLCESINYIIKKYQNLQWVLFVYDYMFVIIENLRHLVAPLNPNVPYYFGHPLVFWGQIYNVAEAGYVLSKAALYSLQAKFNSTEKCQEGGKYWKNEDFYLGKHLGNMGIVPQDTRDGVRSRFHGYSFNHLLFPGRLSKLSSYWKKSLYPHLEGFNCCSDRSVTFHGVEADKLYLLDYLVQHLKVFTGPALLGNLPPHQPRDLVWQDFLKSEGRENFSITAKEYFELWQNKISAPDAFNERIRQEHMGNIEATAAGFANMPDVLESMLSAVRANETARK